MEHECDLSCDVLTVFRLHSSLISVYMIYIRSNCMSFDCTNEQYRLYLNFAY